MSDLGTKIKLINQQYSKLKKCDESSQKQKICKQIIKLSVQAQQLLQKHKNTSQKYRWSSQISDIKSKVIQIELDEQNKVKQTQGSINKKSVEQSVQETEQNLADNKEKLQKKLIRTILLQQISAKEMTVSPQQLEQLAKKMQNNLQIMEEIKKLISEQGEDINNIEQKIINAFNEVEQGNKSLQQAANIQLRTRLRKIKLGISGILGSIGFAIMGIPGAILGLVGGFGLTRFKSKNHLKN